MFPGLSFACHPAPSHRRSRSRVPRCAVLLIAGIILCLSGALAAKPVAVLAQTAAPSLPPTSLRVPRTFFPPGAVMHGGVMGNSAANRLSELHTIPLAQAGRLTGYSQNASWRVVRGHTKMTVTITYLASLFSSPDQAAAARGDASASLWESGLVLPGIPLRAFDLRTAQGGRFLVHVDQHGPVEFETRLQYRGALPASVQRQLRRAFLRLTRAATRIVSVRVQELPAALQVPTSQSSTPVYVADWGVGPVVKSPSLMVADASFLPASALDPGAYRQHSAPISRRVTGSQDLIPGGALARFVRTVQLPGRAGFYDAAALYTTPVAARAAVRRMTAVNDSVTGLTTITSPAAPGTYLPLCQTVELWRTAGQSTLVAREGNVVIVLSAVGGNVASLLALAERLVAGIPTVLHTQGTQIVDAANQPVSLTGLNWYGFEQQDFVPGGLDYRPYADILSTIKELGYTAIRLPFSNQMVEQDPVVTGHLAANPELIHLHALQVMQRIIAAAGALGLRVILDDHRSEAGWSSEASGLWYTVTYPDASFVHDWSDLAGMMAVNNVVVAADLRNEPHGGATWGDGVAATDWRLAAERAGDAALAANPQLLIMVEGVQYYQGSDSYWWGGNLEGVANAPVRLHFAGGSPARSRLVYSAHDYGKDNCGAGCPWFNASTSFASLSAVWDHFWGYISENPDAPYAAPVWVGEFGTCNYSPTCLYDATPGSQGQWFSSFLIYLAQHNLSWAYWSVNGTQSTADTRVYGQLDWYGLLDRTWMQPVNPLSQVLLGLQRTQARGGEENPQSDMTAVAPPGNSRTICYLLPPGHTGC